MSATPRYPVPATRHRTEVTIERSRFICTVSPAPSAQVAQQFVRELNDEFPDASHNCWAYVVGAPGSTGHVGMSDDGEPHGTAGRPMLTVLLHSGIGDIAAVVTRYFGGTRLGTGGLVKAYGGAVQQALQSLETRERVDVLRCSLRVSYSDLSALQQLWSRFEVRVIDEQYADDVSLLLQLPGDRLTQFESAVRDATRGQAQCTPELTG